MTYRALYREWRPKDFSHVVGQKSIIETLRNQVIHHRIAHAYLFCGSRGTGKTSTAKILAKAINCDHPENGDPCGECENCKRLEQEESLDVIEIDAASNNGVDEMRNLRDTVKYPPQFGKYKVYIIDEVHMLSTSAFNALLKTLEEPPAHVVFILATTEPQKLPETILSRCQRFEFGRISIPDIAGRLREAVEGCGAEATDGALLRIARAAEGGMRDALSILDMCLGYNDHVDESLVQNVLGTSDASFLFSFADALSKERADQVFTMIDELIRDGKDPSVFAKDVSSHLRALIVAKTSPEEAAKVLDATDEEAAEYIRQGESFTVSRLMKILDCFMSLETEMRYSSTPRMALENVSLKCCIRTSEADATALNDRIDELERKIQQLSRQIENAEFPDKKTDGEKPEVKNTEPPHEAKKTTGTIKEKSENAASGRRAGGQHVWEELMGRLQKTDTGLWSMLTQGEIISDENGSYRWNPKNGTTGKVFVNTLNKDDRRGKIAGILSEITGISCTFSASDQAQAGPAQDQSEEGYLKTLYETFGKEPVDIVE